MLIYLRSDWLILFVHVATSAFSHCANEHNINYIGLLIGLVDLFLHMAAGVTSTQSSFVSVFEINRYNALDCEAIQLSCLDNCLDVICDANTRRPVNRHSHGRRPLNSPIIRCQHLSHGRRRRLVKQCSRAFMI